MGDAYRIRFAAPRVAPFGGSRARDAARLGGDRVAQRGETVRRVADRVAFDDLRRDPAARHRSAGARPASSGGGGSPPGSRAVMVDGAGHFLHLERPDVVNAEILTFLSE